jgi:(2Fe-2S) ferredoxin
MTGQPTVSTGITKRGGIVLQIPNGRGEYVFAEMDSAAARDIAQALTDAARAADDMRSDGAPVASLRVM